MPPTTAKATPAAAMEIDEANLCPVCHLLLYRPVTTACSHTLCESCMQHWASASRATTDYAMEYFSIDHVPAPVPQGLPPLATRRTGRTTRSQGRAAAEKMDATCPMCRTRTGANLDEARERKVRRKYKMEYEERRVEEEEDAQGKEGEGESVTLGIWVGNEHLLNEEVEGNMHDWKFFVRPERKDLIERAQIYLHPTFKNSTRTFRDPPYEVAARGWGTFSIRVDLFLRNNYVWAVNDQPGRRRAPLKIEWMLNFDGGGLQGRIKADVKAIRRGEESLLE